MGMLLHGIFASSALDSTSEILDIKGLDVSSLAVANYEHESKIPGQVCGKVLKSVKIFKPEDCQNSEQLMFWNRIKIPFLYGIIELFDDVGHSGAMDVAAMALYDQKNKDKYDFRKTFPLIGFSIEGSKINKEQNVITHSLARKVSLTITPANKTCWGEIYQETQEPQTSQQSPINKQEKISKARGILHKMLKTEGISSEQEILIKHDIENLEVLEKAELEKAVHMPTTMPGISEMGIEARRGDVKKPGVVAHGYGRVTKPEVHLGRAKSMAQKQLQSIRQEPKPSLPKSEEGMEKRCWEGYEPVPGKKAYSKGSCRPIKKEESEKLIGGKGDSKSISSFDPKEVKMGRVVESEHTKYPKVAEEITADHLTEDPHYYSKLKDAGLADELEKTSMWSSRRAAQPIQKRSAEWSSRRAVNSMQKALTATTSPLNPEILEPKMQTITKSLDLKKSEAVDVSIPTWSLVEKFKEFIKERVPNLTDKEANAFTRAFKIFKIKAAEKKLKDL